jgi:hypothetical protein
MDSGDKMKPTESQYYNLGRQAHAQGFGVIACNVTDPVKAGFWRGGWHDADIEAGNTVLPQGVRRG